MAVNLSEPGKLSAVPGVELATGAAAIKAADRDDVTLVSFVDSTTIGGVFTQSSFRAAPVIMAESNIELGGVRALLINSGNANAATGEAGLDDARILCQAAADSLGLDITAIAPFSTGVIGERLPLEKMDPVVRNLAAAREADNWLAAARAIMTTDTVAKVISRTTTIAGALVTITGMAKGAGMIKPDMATLLAFVCCDAVVEQDCLGSLTREVVAASFNRITVDGDTSTNDAFVVAATGLADHPRIEDPHSREGRALKSALLEVSRELAQRIVRDAEGATKFVTVRVGGGRDEAECLEVAYTIAESPLVKTALFASDPNWGRLAMAIGRARVRQLDSNGVDAYFDSVQVMAAGVMAPNYLEAAGAEVLARDEFTIRVELSRGEAQAEIWTSDLSYDYVRINAEYRT
ncbi:MAG: bifunctional glutamate N-acetyltransferase/amino-acid acetyltransferase ArgJ [Pseudomonadales bacterium]